MEGSSLIPGFPTDLEVGDVHEDDGYGLASTLEVFRACLPRRGRKAGDDRLFSEAMHFFTVENVRCRNALAVELSVGAL